MSRSKHRPRHEPQPPTPTTGPRQPDEIREALAYTPGDLADIHRLWKLAVEQLHPTSDQPPRLVDPTADSRAARDELARQERSERVENARRQLPTLGYSPAPIRVPELDEITAVQVLLVTAADRITAHVRRTLTDSRPGPHRLLRHPGKTIVKHMLDQYGYSTRLGYGKHAVTGRDVDLIGLRNDVAPALSAASWISRALPAITDRDIAVTTADDVSTARRIVRTVAGYPDLQVRLAPNCFVCEKPALRMNLDKRYVECRNTECIPTEQQCSFTGPHGEPRWYHTEWPWLSKKLGISLTDQARQVLEHAS